MGVFFGAGAAAVIAPQSLFARENSVFKGLASDLNATYADLVNHDDFMKLCSNAGLTHIGGPILGDITPTSVKVWLRTFKPATVQIQLNFKGKPVTKATKKTTVESDLACVLQVNGLEPSTSYEYEIFVDEKPIKIPDNALITTAPDGEKPGQTRIAFGTCPHRWGLGNDKNFGLIRSRKPSALLLGGDIAVQDQENHTGRHRADFFLRDLAPAWQKLVCAMPVYTVWDDHDYFNNDRAGIPKGFTLKDKQNVWKVFTQSWPNPSFGFGPEKQGVHFRSRIGCCDVIMLDTRYFRENVDGSFLGEDQMQWFEDQLLECKGPFTIIASSTMWSDYVSNGKDSWGKWDKAGREHIFKFIEDHKIPGVLLISGDRHGARGFTIPRPSGYQFYEFEVASLGGRSGPPVTHKDWTTQLFGISGEYAFGEFTFDTAKKDPTVTFRLIHEDNRIIDERTLTQSELTPA
jgi:alkaline phosphatase D